jgi:hypothetical protein
MNFDIKEQKKELKKFFVEPRICIQTFARQ